MLTFLSFSTTGKLHGVFVEFCKHDLDCCGNEPDFDPVKLAVPISNFISKCEAMWLALLSEIQTDSETIGLRNSVNLFSCEGKSYHRMIRRIISSEDLGIVLVGTLRICPDSGRLQLVDATGSIDVVVPDLLSDGDVDNVYEVKEYRIVVEGLPTETGHLGAPQSESFSCKSIFCGVLPKRELNRLAIYVHFYLRNARSLNVPLCLPSCKDISYSFGANRGGTFHLLLVTHKFPAIKNFEDNPDISNKSSLFAEAVIFPYDLFLPGENEDTKVTQDYGEKLKSDLEYANGKYYWEKVQFKRLKIAHGLSLGCSSKNNLGDFGNGMCDIPTDCCSSPLEVPCSLTIRSIDDKRLLVPGILFYSNGNSLDKFVDKTCGRKVLLEFTTESFSKYQLLQIGMYYVIKYSKEAICGKVLFNSQTPIWSLSFMSDEVLPDNEPKVSPVKMSTLRSDEVPFQSFSQCELAFLRPPNLISSSPDVCLHLSVESNFLKEEIKALEEGLIGSFSALGEAVSVSMCIRNMKKAPGPPSGAPDLECRLPEGNLVSLYGNVTDVHSFYQNAVSGETESHGVIGNIHQRVQNSICIHVHEDYHMVKIRGAVSTAYPIGMGPGVLATFHRVLTDSFSRPFELMLTPVSFIVINSIKEVICLQQENFCPSPPNCDILNEHFSDIISSDLISQLIQCSDSSKPVRFRCRVVAVHILVLEKGPCKFKCSQQREQLKTLDVRIPLAGFVLDDGSSSCCCWADAERAAMLLRLHETATWASKGSLRRLKELVSSRTENNSYLEEMLKKHHRLTVKNHGSMTDLPGLDLTFSVKSNKVLSCSDENLLKLIVLNACRGPVLSIVGNMMDSRAVGSLERELMEMEVALLSMPNIWAREVGYIDPLAEARNTIQEFAVRP